MDIERLDKLRERLRGARGLFPLVNHQSVLRELARDGSPAAWELLAAQVFESRDERLKGLALELLNQAASPEAVDAVCRIWSSGRDPDLGDLVRRHGWIARDPPDLHVLSALQADKGTLLLDEGRDVVARLADACADSDPEIARRARDVISRFTDELMQQEVWRILIAADRPHLREAVVNARYAPGQDRQRVLVFFLSEQWEKYETLDPKSALLRAVYQSAADDLKLRVRAVALRAGRVEWAREVVTGGWQDPDLDALTDSEWEVAVTILKDARRWDELWRLVQEGPPVWSARIIPLLERSDWSPENAAEQERYREFTGGAPVTRTNPCNLGRFVQRMEVPLGNSGAVHAIAITPDCRLLASGCDDGSIRLWQVPNKEPLKVLSAHRTGVTALAISPDGGTLFSASSDQTIRRWRLPAGEPLGPLTGQKGRLMSLVISPDGETLASGSSDGSVRLWRLPGGELTRKFERRTNQVSTLAIAPDAKAVVGSSEPKQIGLWRLPETEIHKYLAGHSGQVLAVAISPDGGALASGSDEGAIRLWRMPDGEPLLNLNGRHAGGVTSVAFSPDGKILVTGSWDRTVRVWNRMNGEPLRSLDGHIKGVTALAVSRDGRLLASGSADRTVRLWDLRAVRLPFQPVRQASAEDRAWVNERADSDDATPEEREWLEFIRRLMRMSTGLNLRKQAP